MPYASLDELPKYLNKYSRKVRSQWRYVFNSVWKKLTKEGITGTQREKRAFMAANSVLKKRTLKEKNSQDYIFTLVDMWMNRLNG